MAGVAAVYVRISDDREGAGLGVARQLEDCCALASKLELAVGEVYEDNDVSAYRAKARPQYERLLRDVAARRWDAVIVWHTDRLTRSPAELETWITAAEAAGEAVPVHTVTAGPVDLESASGRLTARMQGNIARYEVEHKAERQRRQARQAAEKGRLGGGGHRAYGYDTVYYLDERQVRRARYEVNEPEAAIIREAAARVLSGEPVRAVARDLTARGVLTSTGKEWSAQTLRRMLMSARLSGQREHQPRARHETTRQVVGPIVAAGDGSWEPILTPVETAALRDLLLDPTRRLTHAVPRRCLLSGGLLRCGQCGSTMSGRPKDNGVMRYICPAVPGAPSKCGRTYVRADWVDAFVVGHVLAALDTPELQVQRDEEQDEELRQNDLEEAEDQEQLKTFARMLANREMSHLEFATARRTVMERIEKRRAGARQVLRRRPARLMDQDYRAAWPDLALDQRQAVLRAVVDSVVVGPGRRGLNRFDAERVTINWLH